MKLITCIAIAALVGLAVAGISGAPAEAIAATLVDRTLADGALGAVAFGGLIVNRDNLVILNRTFKAAFQNGLGMVQPMWNRVATEVPSGSAQNDYGWLGQLPGVREWIGDRVVHNLAQHSYSIANKDYELTVTVKRPHIEDDQYGVYKPIFQEFGRSVSAFPDQLVYALLKDGFTQTCYDGQAFFSTTHPVLGANGKPVNVANTDGGAGAPWFLIDDSRALKPIIYQLRRQFGFVAKDSPDDENVFHKNAFIYGTDGRANVGFGFWQFAWGSKQTLNKTNYKTARESLMAMKGDYGRPLGVRPRVLVVPPSLEGNALEILNAERDAAGATNVYKGTAQLLVCEWLA